MKIYIIEASGKHPVTPDWTIQRHPNAFTSREAAEAAKDAFLKSVWQSFDQRYGVEVEIIELEVAGPQSVWVAFVDESAMGSGVIAHRRTKDEILLAVQLWMNHDGREWTSDSEGHWESYRWSDGLYDYVRITEVTL